MTPKQYLELGAMHPFDSCDAWNMNTTIAPPARDKAHATARGIIVDLLDRRGVKQGFNNLDEDVRVELVESLAAIIREGMQ